MIQKHIWLISLSLSLAGHDWSAQTKSTLRDLIFVGIKICEFRKF